MLPMSDITVFKISASVALQQAMGFYQGVITIMGKAHTMAERHRWEESSHFHPLQNNTR